MSFMDVWSCCYRVRSEISRRALFRCRPLFSRPDNDAPRAYSKRELDTIRFLFFSETRRTRTGDGCTSFTLFTSPLHAFVPFSCCLLVLLVSYRVAS